MNRTSPITRSLAFCALLSAVAFAPAQSMDTMKSMTSETLYTRLGGIHKIAQFTADAVVNCMNDSVLMQNENFAKTNKNFPAPAISFLLTSYFASKTGGPQMYSGPNLGGIEKWFMLTPEQMDHQHMIVADAMKKAGCDPMAIDEFTKWWMADAESATALEPTPEMITDKDSLYGRLGGIAPIALVVDDFVNALATDKTLLANPHTVKALTDGHVTGAGLKFLVTEQLAMAAGGPWKYSGRTMADSHKGLGISEDEWTAGAKLLIASLNKFHVPDKEQGEILAAVSATKGDIVGH